MVAADLALTGNRWADLLIAFAALVSASGVLWRKVLKPIVRGFATLDRVLPVLLEIGQQFQPNSGATLKDSLNRIEVRLGEGRNQIAELIIEVGDQRSKLDSLYVYAHDNNHKLTGGFSQLTVSYESLARDLKAVRGALPSTTEEE